MLAGRLGSLDALHDRGLGWATDLERDGDQEEGSHVFAGWIEDAGKVRWVENWFHPDRPQDVAPEMVERFRKLDGCGGVLARLDDAAALSRVEDVRHTASKWRGRPLQSLGPVAADRLARALGPVASYELETLLDEEGSASCMLALEGRRVVALGSQGDVYRFNQKETKHLARVGLLPRHWYLPMQWWKKKKEEEKQEEDERKGKVRVYKGRYDDEDEIGHEEKEEYGE